jgi:hypothetical protein
MKKLLRGIFFAFIAVSAIAIVLSVSYASADAIDKVQQISMTKGALALGMSKQEVLKIMGKPGSPLQFDFVYSNGKDELVVCFDDKTNLVESIIVRGKSIKYSVAGIKIGDPQEKVKKVCGVPEALRKYEENGECWSYPSKNLSIAFDGQNKVVSYSISSYYPELEKK